MINDKKCPKCDETKDISEFDKRGKVRYEKYKHTAAGYHTECKSCKAIAKKAWYEGNLDHVKHRDRNTKLKYYYGIDTDDYNRMFKEQNGCCKVCGLHQSDYNRAFSVDHCHTTLKVRGLLCHKCNLALGYANDNIEILTNLINYLKEANHGK